MGVIKGSKNIFGYHTGDDIEHIEPELSSEDEHSTVVSGSTARRRVPARLPPCHGDMHLTEAISRRRKGAKQARRCDNLRELINMVESEDLELDFNIFEPSTSVFAELLTERKKMEVWNEFVNSTEEEQMELLQCSHNCRQEDCGRGGDGAPGEDITDNNGSSADSAGTDGADNCDSDGWEHLDVNDVKDKRSAHPSFSAEQCFLRLDKNIRTMLRRRQRPMGMLMSIEQDLISFFHEWPTSVYISKLSSSYERMMLHALSQYLDLSSKSYDCGDIRQTHVENPNPLFVPPPVLLTQYLQNSTAAS